MKLLKALTAGAIALAMSTNAMALPLSSRAVLNAFNCKPGILLSPTLLCIAKGLVVKIGSKGILRSGFSSPVLGELGPIARVDDGATASRFFLFQAMRADTNPLSNMNFAPLDCATETGPGSAAFVPSFTQLQQIQEAAPNLREKFLNYQADPNALVYRVSAGVRGQIADGIKEGIGFQGQVFSSTEDSDDPSNVKTIGPGLTPGVLAKSATGAYMCVRHFQTSMLEATRLLGS